MIRRHRCVIPEIFFITLFYILKLLTNDLFCYKRFEKQSALKQQMNRVGNRSTYPPHILPRKLPIILLIPSVGHANELRSSGSNNGRTSREPPFKRREPFRLRFHIHAFHLAAATASRRGVLPHLLEDRICGDRWCCWHCFADHTRTV